MFIVNEGKDFTEVAQMSEEQWNESVHQLCNEIAQDAHAKLVESSNMMKQAWEAQYKKSLKRAVLTTAVGTAVLLTCLHGVKDLSLYNKRQQNTPTQVEPANPQDMVPPEQQLCIEDK